MPDFTLPLEDYRRLLLAAEADDMIVKCETCGAWLDLAEPACAAIADFTGCWKAATRDGAHDHLCKSYRAIE
jgi:hypothetical protein